jgi:hypothetical protein
MKLVGLYLVPSRLEAAVKQVLGRTQEFEYQLRAVEVRRLHSVSMECN